MSTKSQQHEICIIVLEEVFTATLLLQLLKNTFLVFSLSATYRSKPFKICVIGLKEVFIATN